jgi:hypothetical protein
LLLAAFELLDELALSDEVELADEAGVVIVTVEPSA